MANTLDLMDVKQIITLKTDGLSNRKIGSLLGISRNTINTCPKDGGNYKSEFETNLPEKTCKDLRCW